MRRCWAEAWTGRAALPPACAFARRLVRVWRPAGPTPARPFVQRGGGNRERSAENGVEFSWRSAVDGSASSRRSAVNGFTSSWRSAVNGFTLVELMVVIAIIGLASAAVILAIPDPRGRLVDDADRFAVRLASARDYAVIEARPVAVWVSPTAYGFALYRDGQWSESDDKPFRTTSWRIGTHAQIDGAAGGGRLMLRFDSTGLPSQAARIALERQGEHVAVRLDGAGKVTVGG